MRGLFPIFVVVLAGCAGGDHRLSHDEYQRRIGEIVRGSDSREADRLFFDLVANEYSRAECATRAREFHERLEAILADVQALEPPEDAEAPQREFVEAAKVSVDRVAELADEVGSGRLRCGRSYNQAVYGLASTRDAQDAVEQLQARGYFVFGE
jgi:hypothetical protein